MGRPSAGDLFQKPVFRGKKSDRAIPSDRILL